MERSEDRGVRVREAPLAVAHGSPILGAQTATMLAGARGRSSAQPWYKRGGTTRRWGTLAPESTGEACLGQSGEALVRGMGGKEEDGVAESSDGS